MKPKHPTMEHAPTAARSRSIRIRASCRSPLLCQGDISEKEWSLVTERVDFRNVREVIAAAVLLYGGATRSWLRKATGRSPNLQTHKQRLKDARPDAEIGSRILCIPILRDCCRGDELGRRGGSANYWQTDFFQAATPSGAASTGASIPYSPNR